MDSLLVCKYNKCNNFLLQPVLLPCSNHVCKYHIDALNNKEKFKCIACNNEHEMQKNGIIVNKTLADILDLNLHLNTDQKRVSDLTSKLKHNLDEFDVLIKEPESFITNYVSETLKKIEIERERLVSQINAMSNEMIVELKMFENECKINSSNKSNGLNQEYKSYLSFLKNEILIWKEELRMPKFDKKRLDELANVTSQLIKKIENLSLEYKSNLLMNKGCCFIEKNTKFTEELFGKLEIDESLNLKSFIKIREKNFQSAILNPSQSIDLIDLCDFDSEAKFKLLYRATRDGFSAKIFHEKCDSIPETLTIIKASGSSNVFGGFCYQPWDDCSGYKKDNRAFIFSLINKDNFPLKIEVSNSECAFYCGSNYGPTFGRGHDIYISNNSNTNGNSLSKLGHSYLSVWYPKGSNESKNYLGGSERFLTDEIEVFQVIN